MRQWSPRARLGTYLRCQLIAQRIQERSWTDEVLVTVSLLLYINMLIVYPGGGGGAFLHAAVEVNSEVPSSYNFCLPLWV